jgi:hypothetical protein
MLALSLLVHAQADLDLPHLTSDQSALVRVHRASVSRNHVLNRHGRQGSSVLRYAMTSASWRASAELAGIIGCHRTDQLEHDGSTRSCADLKGRHQVAAA